MFLTSTCNLYTLGYISHDGKENGNQYSVYRGYVVIIEKTMETAMV